MIKKLIIGGGVVCLAAVLLAGTGVVSYMRTSAGYLKDSVRDSVPAEFEIERARGMIDDLVPELKRNMYRIAKEETEVKRLTERIDKIEERLTIEKEQILRLTADLESANDDYRYAGRDYTEKQVRFDLANRLQRYKGGEATLTNLFQIHVAREQSLAAARQKLEGMQVQKRNLEVAVEELEAKVQMIAAAKASSNYEFDDSRMGRARELIADLRTRLEVDESLVFAESHFHGQIPLDETGSEDIVEEVANYFDQDNEIPLDDAIASTN